MGPDAATEPSGWVRRFGHLVPKDGPVLDVAAGAGRHARWFADLGYAVTAVDRDVSRLRGHDKIRAVAADLENGRWPFEEHRFGGVIVTNYLWRPLLPRLAASMAVGGVLLYETFAVGNEAFGRPRNPDYLLGRGELLDAFGDQLEVVAFEHGLVHRPKPAVVQRLCAVRGSDAQLIR